MKNSFWAGSGVVGVFSYMEICVRFPPLSNCVVPGGASSSCQIKIIHFLSFRCAFFPCSCISLLRCLFFHLCQNSWDYLFYLTETFLMYISLFCIDKIHFVFQGYLFSCIMVAWITAEIEHEFTLPSVHVHEECTAIKVPFPGWKQHSSVDPSGSARLRAAAPPGTRWHGWLVLSVKVHVPGHRGLSHPSHITSFRLQSARLTCHAHGCVSYKCSLRGRYKDRDAVDCGIILMLAYLAS